MLTIVIYVGCMVQRVQWGAEHVFTIADLKTGVLAYKTSRRKVRQSPHRRVRGPQERSLELTHTVHGNSV